VETVAIQGDFYAGRLYIYSNLMQITKGSNWLKILFLALDLLQAFWKVTLEDCKLDIKNL